MKITKLTFDSKRSHWTLKSTDFSDLTLLVGVSGVGKTRILNAIMQLREIASGGTVSGTKWILNFETSNRDKVVWEGETEIAPDEPFYLPLMIEDARESNNKAKFISERISINGEEIVSRSGNGITFRSSSMPKLSSVESVIKIFNEEDAIKPLYAEILKIIIRDQTNSRDTLSRIDLVDFNAIKQKFSTSSDIKEANLPTLTKLALIFEHKRSEFFSIKTRFCEIFPQVDDVGMESPSGMGIPTFLKNVPQVKIKEKGVDKWLQQNDISSGMMRTLLHISDLFLCPDGSVILIDEFENSLGVNCINTITEDMLRNKGNLQFIITSHHPYIINNVNFKSWKIVRRSGSIVSTHDPAELGIGKSSHDAFMQLINSDDYREGIDVP